MKRLIIASLLLVQSAFGQSSLLTGLQAYYKLEDLTDSSANALTLTNNGSVTFVAGKVNNCANFVATSSQYLSHADAAPFQMGTGDLSVSAWFNTTSGSLSAVAMYGSASAGKIYGLYMNSGIIGTVQDGTNFDQTTNDFSQSDGAWHFAVMTAKRSGNIILYLDNVVHSSAAMTATGSVNQIAGFQIGAEATTNELYTGKVDEVGVWNRELTSAEVAILWNSGAGITYPFGAAASPSPSNRFFLFPQ